MQKIETFAAPWNTEKQLVGRVVCPIVGDWFESAKSIRDRACNSPVKVASTVTVITVHADGVSFRYHGPLGESDHWVCRTDYEKMVRKTLEHGSAFHPANAETAPRG